MLDCADSSFSSLIFLFWVFIWSVFKLNAMKIRIFVQMISLLLKQGPLCWDECHKIKINLKCQLFTLLIIVGFGLLRCWNFSSEKQKCLNTTTESKTWSSSFCSYLSPLGLTSLNFFPWLLDMGWGTHPHLWWLWVPSTLKGICDGKPGKGTAKKEYWDLENILSPFA